MVLYLKNITRYGRLKKDNKSYQRKEFTAEEGRKIREIFEEFDDEDDGNKTIH